MLRSTSRTVCRVRCADRRLALRPGGIFCFTLLTAERRPKLTTPLGRALLRQVAIVTRHKWPFEAPAMVLLPGHPHAIWRLPAGDSATRDARAP